MELLPEGVSQYEEDPRELELDPDEVELRVGESVSAFDPKFSQSREGVTHATPSREAILAEGEALRVAMERQAEKLDALRSAGADSETLDRAEATLDRIVDRWVEWQGEAEEESPAPAANLDGYFSLTSLLTRDLDSGAELADREQEIRVATLRALALYVTQSGVANPWLAFKNFLAVLRRVLPTTLDGITKADLAILLGETRAATGDREIRLVEKYLKKWGVKGFQLLGGNKSMETRRRCAAAQRGNNNRRKGAQRKYQ